MKKCPYCAEEIKDEAIVCRYCGRDLVPNVDQVVNSRAQSNQEMPNKAIGKIEFPSNYVPPASDIKKLSKAKMEKFQQGDWKLLASPPSGGYTARHYNNKLTQHEFAKLKEDMLTWAWDNSNKTLEDLKQKINISADRVKGSFFSIRSKYMELAAQNAKDWLLSGIPEYSSGKIWSNYRSFVQRMFTYALIKPPVGSKNIGLSPLERLEKIDQDPIFNYSKEIPDEYFNLVLEEAKKLISNLGENPTLYIPVWERPGLLDELERLAEKLADEIDMNHKKMPHKSPEKGVVFGEEIETVIKNAVKDDPKYDKDAISWLYTKTRKDVEQRGYL